MSEVSQFKFPAKCLAIIFFSIIFFQQALAALPSVPPEMLNELKKMSPAQQAELAEQYGFELPGADMSAAPDSSSVGLPGQELLLDPRVQQRIAEEEAQRLLADEESEIEDKDSVLSRFGAELFDTEISTFAPVDDMPAPDGYLIGPGDILNLYLYGSEELDVALPVNREGQLILPRFGPISVVGLTFEEVKEIIEAKVASQMVATKAVVSLGKLRAISVFLSGDVVYPGSYSVSGLSTVMQVLYAGGGVSDIGSLRDIQVKRRGEVVARLDVYDILLNGDNSGDVRLAAGDTVFVPPAERLVTIDGEVKRPAIYEVLERESIGDLLRMSGGVSAAGYAKAASVERRLPGRSSLTRVQINLENASDLEQGMFDGDRLTVQSIKEEIYGQVILRGAVARPGGYQWFDGQRISDLIGNLDEDLLVESDLSSGLVVRRTGIGLEIEAIALKVGDALQNPGGESDLVLEEKDEILIFALPYLNDSYQALVEAAEERSSQEEDRDLPEKAIQFTPDGELVFSRGEFVFSREEEDEEEPRKYDDRADLIEEVVFRLEAQARSPASTKIVNISGDVRLPGRYPLIENLGLEGLISLAGGFERSAYLEDVEITRVSFEPQGGAKTGSFKMDLKSEQASSFKLQPLDQVRVARIPNWSYGSKVELAGLIAFPGEYAITPGETLASVMSRAGGTTENAFPEGAVLVKVEAKKREKAQLERLISAIRRDIVNQSLTREREEGAASTSPDVELDLLDNLLVENTLGRVVIDLPAIMAGDADADIQLEDGDRLFVPAFNNTITVIGEVRQPGTFRFDPARTVADYLQFAAGTTVRADSKETYVVRADGRVQRVAVRKSLLSFSPSDAGKLSPGDSIIVPVNEEYQPSLARYREVSTVVFQSIASLYPLFRL